MIEESFEAIIARIKSISYPALFTSTPTLGERIKTFLTLSWFVFNDTYSKQLLLNEMYGPIANRYREFTRRKRYLARVDVIEREELKSRRRAAGVSEHTGKPLVEEANYHYNRYS